MGTDTDTQFLMSSDSGSKVQVGDEKKDSQFNLRAGRREGEASKADKETECDGKGGDEHSCSEDWPGKVFPNERSRI